MILRVGDVNALAGQVRSALSRGERHEALRWVAEFVWDVDHSPATGRAALLADRPDQTGDPAWDAMLAGVVEMLAARHGLGVPQWTAEPDRFLTTWWFFTDRPGLMVSAFTESPAALANRGVFIHAASLESV